MLKIIKCITLHRKVNRLLKDIDVQLQSTPEDTKFSRSAIYNCRVSLTRVRDILGPILDLDLFDPVSILRATLFSISVECYSAQQHAHLARGRARDVYEKYRKSLERISYNFHPEVYYMDELRLFFKEQEDE